MQLIETRPKYRKYNPDIVRHLLATDEQGVDAAWVYIAMVTPCDAEICCKILDHELDRVSKRTANKMAGDFWEQLSKGKIKFKKLGGGKWEG